MADAQIETIGENPPVTNTGWLPIETAPIEKPVLGFQATPGDYENQMAVCWPIAHERGRFWMGAGGLTPTHWMPLPEPPK